MTRHARWTIKPVYGEESRYIPIGWEVVDTHHVGVGVGFRRLFDAIDYAEARNSQEEHDERS